MELLKLIEYNSESIYRQMTKQLQNYKVQTRLGASNGLWCSVLLPSLLVLYSLTDNVSATYAASACISVGLLIYTGLFYIHIIMVPSYFLKRSFSGCIPSGLVSALLLIILLKFGVIESLLIAVPSVTAYYILLRTAILECPNTFTMGEAVITCQSIILFATSTVVRITDGCKTWNGKVDFVDTIVSAVILTAISINLCLAKMNEEDRTIKNLAIIMVSICSVTLVVLHILLGWKVLLDFIYFMLMYNRPKMFTACLCLVLMAVLIIISRTQEAAKADTTTRKSFHVLATLVFATGIIVDVEFMRLAAGCTFGVLLLVEGLRLSQIEPFSSVLQSVFDVYSDEKDSGYFALTPLYMFTGMWSPIVLCRGGPIELLSGAVALGPGDSAASWAGTRWGSRNWEGTNKTYVGTAANITAQIAFIMFLQAFGFLDRSIFLLLRGCITAVVTGLVEAKTDQVDNLVLPLVALISYRCTFFLASSTDIYNHDNFITA